MYHGHIAAQHLSHRGRPGPRPFRPARQPVLSRSARTPWPPAPTPPFRADHVGSLLRLPSRSRARADRAAGAITAGQLTRAEDDAIRDAVAMQEAAGLRSATDGEFRCAERHTDFIARLGDIRYAAEWTPTPGVRRRHRDDLTQAHATRGTGKVHLAEPELLYHFRFLGLGRDHRGAQAHHPPPEQGPLPRCSVRQRRRRPGRVPRRPRGRLRRRDRRARRPGRPLPPARRHPVRVHERPRPGASAPPPPASIPTASTRSTSPSSTRP